VSARILPLAATLGCICLLAACSTAEQPSAPAPAAAPAEPAALPQKTGTPEKAAATGSIIVKPRERIDSAALMKNIGEKMRAPERVAFVRAMSGDAYVLNVAAPATAADVPNIIAELNATGLFEYVEADEQLTIQR
jgi:hypothetical protein